MRQIGLRVVCAAVVVLVMLSAPAGAGIYAMTDANSTAVVDSSGSGMYDWTVDNVQHLNRQWFWYRVGATGPESNLGALPLSAGGVSDTNFDGNNETLYLRYLATQFKAELTFLLTGGSAGSGASGIAEAIRITNTSGAPLDFHFFQYVNLHLGGSAINDSVAILNGNTARQTYGNMTVSETVETPMASHHEVGFYPGTVNSLSDGSPTTLSDVSGAIGPGDLTWAFEWDVTIASGGSYIIGKDKHVVPEPASICLLAAASLVTLKRRGTLANRNA